MFVKWLLLVSLVLLVFADDLSIGFSISCRSLFQACADVLVFSSLYG